jgi:outer membrane lipoprotein-sorting protein
VLEPHYSVAELNAPINQSVTSVASASSEDPRLSKPTLAQGVRLVGKMNGLGFQDQQWLIDRNGQFLQVTELLYRVAEQANGTHTLEQIADSVSSLTEWSLDAGDVEHLIDAKLIPLGILGTGARDDQSQASPLGINVKFRTLRPRFIEPITSVLHHLCNWLVVALVVIAAGVGNYWLFRMHGLSRAVEDAIYTPGGVLVALGMVLLAAFFHEFGHASALRHHGGRVGNMGIALYIIYPALYTDVTDNYRLSRWARVSTDLGGIYFHLIFTLGLFAAYFATHRELYLFCVLLIDLAIVEQFIPVIRLDGYWFLCDITGIPDFFSFMTPFVNSSLPSQAGRVLQNVTGTAATKSTRLPDLKPWARAVFITYIVITVPLLIYVFGLMIVSLPELFTTAWGGLQAQIAILKAISLRKDFITVLLVLLQIVFLTLPVPATIYFLWITIKPSLNRFVDWTSRTRGNAFAGVTAVVACCAITAAFVSVPSIRPFHRASDPAKKAENLIGETQKATSQLNSLTADLEGSIGEDTYTGRMVLQRPNLARVEINGSKGLGKILLVSNGTTATTYFPDTNRFVQVAPGQHGEFIQSTVIQQVEQFFHPESLQSPAGFNYLGHRSSDGMEYDVVEPKDAASSDEKVDYFISRNDKLIHRTIENVKPGATSTTWLLLKNVRSNATIDKRLFAWTLPKTATQVQMPAGVQIPVK